MIYLILSVDLCRFVGDPVLVQYRVQACLNVGHVFASTAAEAALSTRRTRLCERCYPTPGTAHRHSDVRVAAADVDYKKPISELLHNLCSGSGSAAGAGYSCV